MIVLRRLVDTILYHQIKMQNWVVRRVMLEYRIREIDPTTVQRTVEIASELNREERLNFHLVSDLTTVVHVGDLVKVSFTSAPPSWSLIELKGGKMNALLGDIIEKAGGDLREEHMESIRNQFGAKAVSQVKRMVRQQERHRELMQVITTDEGIDIMHRTRIKLNPEIVHIDNYGEILGKLCIDASSKGVAVSVIDDCMRIVAMNRQTYEAQGRMGVAHVLYHLQFNVKECSLRAGQREELKASTTIFPFFDLAQMNLYAMWPPPIFLWNMPRNLICDLLFGRVLVFGQLDYSKLFELAITQGIEMRWATDKELGDFGKASARIPGSPGAKGVAVRLLDKPELKQQILLIGFFSRMFLEFMSPSQFLKLARRGFDIFH
jgi:hypothetical protein